MASGSGGSNAFTWFVIGVLTGVAGTLAVLIWSGRHHAREEQPTIESASPAVVYRPPSAAPLVKPAPLAALPASSAPAAAPASSAADSQVAEDAAAAGMTSRSRAPNPPPQ